MAFAKVAQRSAQYATVPAPVGGLNAYDSLAAMPPTDAVALLNLVPQPYGCTVRKGYIQHASDLPGSVDTIAPWASREGATKLFAWSSTGMYDITLPGAAGAPIVTSLTTAWWNVVQMGNAAGTHLVAFNGIDDGIWYSSAGVARLTAGDGIVSGTWNGVNPAHLIQATVHQRRLWAVEVDTTYGWYLPADQIYGVAAKFDFGPFFKRGGYLVALMTWTIDAGDGSDDKLVALSSAGEAVVFSGIDVSSASDWNLVGVYFVGAPVRGRRFYTNMAGDLLLCTLTGIVSMATVVTSTQVNVSANNTYSKKIQFLISDLTSTLGDLDGWEVRFIPAINLLFVNVPSVYAGGSGQVVANNINQAWCVFQGWDAQCIAQVDGLPYFGDKDGSVWRAWFGDKDAVLADGSGGTNILSYCQQAYSYLGVPAVDKQIGMYRPNIMSIRESPYSSEIIYDFAPQNIPSPSGGATPGGASLWGVALWGVNRWYGSFVVQRKWTQAQGIGCAASIKIAFTSDTETTWISTDYTYKVGGPL